MGTLATTVAHWGKFSDAEAIYAELTGRARRSYVPPSILALAAGAATPDKAVRRAREAFEIRDPMSQFKVSTRFFLSQSLHQIELAQSVEAGIGIGFAVGSERRTD